MRLFFKKFFNLNTLKILLCVLCILFLILTPNHIFNKQIYSKDINKYLSKLTSEQVVIDLWHIESFEGGKKSRKKYLEEIGIKFNKINPNIFVSVWPLTEEQLFLNLQNGLLPDAFSFSVGSGSLLTSYLKTLPTNINVRENLQEYSKINKQILAYPYMLSCYVAISKNSTQNNLKAILNSKVEKNKFGYTFCTQTNINVAQVLLESNIQNINRNLFLNSSSTYQSYTNFVLGKANTLIGTMRDYYRCKNREELGKIHSCYYEPLTVYSDLIQYIGINKNISETKSTACQNFLNYLLNSNSQNLIKDYGLFSTTNLKIYQNTELTQTEQKLFNSLKSINVFTGIEEINNKKEESFNKLFS